MADTPIRVYTSIKKLSNQAGEPSIPPSLETPPAVINPGGSGSGVKLYTQLGDVTDKDYIGKNGYFPVVTNESELTLIPQPQSEEYRLISGGVVQWTGSGYVFNVSGAFYRIGGVLYESQPAIKTLSTPDPTNNRIDVFAVDNTGAVVVIVGTPSATPVKPQVNPTTQLELTSVIVTAASITPTLTEEVVYDQNIEWVGSKTGVGTVAFNSAVAPYQGTLAIETTNIEDNLKVRLTDGANYDLSTVQTLGMQLRLKSQMFAGQNIGVTFLNSSGVAVSNELILSFDKALSGAYQFIGIALTSFSFTSFIVRSIEFRFIRSKGPAIYDGYFLDIIKLEGGINPPITIGSFTALTDTPNSYLGQAGKSVAVKADESGLEFIAGGGGGVASVTGDGVGGTATNPVITQTNKVRVIDINSVDLPISYTLADIATYLNTLGVTIAFDEIIGLEIKTLWDGLVAYWKFDSNGTDSVASKTPSLNTGITFGAVGKIGNAAVSTGVNNFILRYADSDDFSFTSGGGVDLPFSMSFWIYPTALSSTGNWIINKRDETSGGDEYQVTIASGADANKLSMVLFDRVTNASAFALTSVSTSFGSPLNAWKHIAITYDGSKNINNIKVYLNGVEETMIRTVLGTYTGMNNGGATLGFFNANWNPANNFGYQGRLDEFGIWKNKQISSADVIALYNSGSGKTYP